jgi:hypothetical protein
MSWKKFQKDVVEFFHSLGCDATEDTVVAGVRAKHKIDVFVRFKRFGIEIKWVIECKYWNTSIPKEKVLVLAAIVDDVGADRGILISKVGFQSGAIRAAQVSNITLTSLEELKEISQGDLISALLQTLETKVIQLKDSFFSLFASEDINERGFRMSYLVPKPGIDGNVVTRSIGELAFLENGFQRVKLRRLPYIVRVHPSGKGAVTARTLEEFVGFAEQAITSLQAELDAQVARNQAALAQRPLQAGET